MFPRLLANGRLTNGSHRLCDSLPPHRCRAEQNSQHILFHVVTKALCPRRAVGLSYLQAVNKVGAVGGGTCSGGGPGAAGLPAFCSVRPSSRGRFPLT